MKKKLAMLSGIILLIISGLIFWNYDSIKIMLNNKDITGKVESIPALTLKEFPPITTTEEDWTNWLGADLSNSATVKNLSNDLKNS